MKPVHLFMLCALATGGSLSLQAQNIFPANGAVGIGTNAPTAALQITTTEAFGGNALQIDPWSDAAGAYTGQLRLMELASNGTNYVGFKAPTSITSNKIYILPASDGAGGQFLTTDGNGTLSWSSAAKGANKKLSNLTAPTTIYVDLLPGNDNNRNLGSTTYSWKDLFLDGKMYLNGQRFTFDDGINVHAVGNNAGINNTTGYWNTFEGYQSGYSNSSGSANTFLGSTTGYSNSTGYANTFIGAVTGYSNTTGFNNTYIGTNSGSGTTTGANNTALGANSLSSNTTGLKNIAIGSGALYNNETGDSSVAIGYYALYESIDNNANIALGSGVMENLTEGDHNIAIGIKALQLADDADDCIAIGNKAMGEANNPYNSIAIGENALYSATGGYNEAIGRYALANNTWGAYNVVFGMSGLYYNYTGFYNTAVGAFTGLNAYNGDNCSYFGYGADVNDYLATYSNATALGAWARVSADNQVRLGSTYVTSIGGYANWTNLSDGRFKENIQADVPGLEFINKLTPVTYTLDVTGLNKSLHIPDTAFSQSEIKTKEDIRYTGFIAQDVEKAAQELHYDFSGVDAPKNDKDMYGLRYAEFVVPLTKAVQELSAMEDEKDARISTLEAEVAELKESMTLLMQQLQNNTIQSNVVIPATQSTGMVMESAWLEQNTPNPFDGTTVIRCYVPEHATHASLIISGSNGVVLQRLEITASGLHAISVDAQALASGTYYYTLVIDGQTIDSKQMIHTR